MSDELIYVDTREQRPWTFAGRPTRLICLHYGDYSAPSLVGKFEVERKSVADLVGSLTTHWVTFRAKIVRWQKACAVRVVIVEGTLQQVLSFRYLRFNKRPWMLRNLCVLMSTGTSVLFAGSEEMAADLCLRMIDDRRLQKAEGEFAEALETGEAEPEPESVEALAEMEKDPSKPW